MLNEEKTAAERASDEIETALRSIRHSADAIVSIEDIVDDLQSDLDEARGMISEARYTLADLNKAVNVIIPFIPVETPPQLHLTSVIARLGQLERDLAD